MGSSHLEDKILAVLGDVEEPKGYFDRIISKILKLPEKDRADSIRKLLTAVKYRPKLKLLFKRLTEGGKCFLRLWKR